MSSRIWKWIKVWVQCGILLSGCSTVTPARIDLELSPWRWIGDGQRCCAIASDPAESDRVLVAGENRLTLTRLSDGTNVKEKGISRKHDPLACVPFMWRDRRIYLGIAETLLVLKDWELEKEIPLAQSDEAGLAEDLQTGAIFLMTNLGLYRWDTDGKSWTQLVKGYQLLTSYPAHVRGAVLTFGGIWRNGVGYQPFDRQVIRGSSAFWIPSTNPSFIFAADIPFPAVSRDGGMTWTRSETRIVSARHCAGLDTPNGPALFVESHSGNMSSGSLIGPSQLWVSRDQGKTFDAIETLQEPCTSMMVIGTRLVVLTQSGSIRVADIVIR